MKIAHLQAVAHDIAHHAQSSQSPLHYTLHQACQAAGVTVVTINLMPMTDYPEDIPCDDRLARSVDALREMFSHLLAARGFVLGDVSAARLLVAYSPEYPSLKLFSTQAMLNAQGRTFERTFPLPSRDELARLDRERGMTLLDCVTTRAALARELGEK